MSAVGKVIKLDLLAHTVKVVAAGLALYVAVRGLRAAMRD